MYAQKLSLKEMLVLLPWQLRMLRKEYRRRRTYRALLQANARWMGKHKGERCVVVGNGPSLRLSDLEALQDKGIPTFASNKIFMWFDKTSWRPTYYAVCDDVLYHNFHQDIDNLDLEKFFPLDIYETIAHYCGHLNVFSRLRFQFFNNLPAFHPDLVHGFLGEGGTVTFHLLQLAAAMGFSEIYLLGVDFNYSFGIGQDGKYHTDPTVKDHFEGDHTRVDNVPNLYHNLKAFEAAQRYTLSHPLKIYNATRGGKLEVFPRASIDTLLS